MVVDLPGTGDGDDDDDGDDKGDEDDDEGGGGDEDDDAVLILLPNFILFSLFLDHPSSSSSFSSTSHFDYGNFPLWQSSYSPS